MKNNTTIYCCYHNKQQKINFKNDNLFWVYGPNDPLNEFYSEFSMFKWIYMNDKNSDYIGCCHYRRQLNINEIDYKYLDNNHCIVLNRMLCDKPGAYGIRKWSRIDWQDCEWLYFDFIEYIRTKDDYIKYYHADELSADINLMYSRSTFIMNRYHFFNLWEFIGGFFDFIDKKYNLNYNYTKYQNFLLNYRNKSGKFSNQSWFYKLYHRLFAYIGEWLVSDYIVANFNLKNVKYIHDYAL